MTPLVDYWLKANLFLVLFYGCYVLLLRRHTFLTLNRTYLVGSVLVALLLPLVHVPGLAFPWPWEHDLPVYSAVSAEVFTVVGSGIASQADTPLLPDWPVLSMWMFALVAAGLLLRTVWRTVSLFRLIRQWPAQPMDDHTLVLPDKAQTPTFSFFQFLVLNPDDVPVAAIRQHELVHIRQRHSLDVIFLEVVQAFCWLNPALFGYRQAIRQVHEYLADRDATAQTTDHRDAYARFLVNYAFHLPTDSLTHSFGANRPDSPTLKQRIQMLYQQHTHRRALWKYALVLPLATALLAMTNVPESTSEPAPGPGSGAEPTVNEPGTFTPKTVWSDSTKRMTRVEGFVLDRRSTYEARLPLPGANIVVRNGHKGTTTDSQGRFKIDVPAGTELVASFVGFEAQSMVVSGNGGDAVFVFKLKPQTLSGVTTPEPASKTPPTVSQTVPFTSNSGEVFSVVEQNPTFPGGNTELYRFIVKNLRYPAAAARANVQGMVFVSFVVSTDGSIGQINVLKGMGFGMDEEAVRVVAQMPKWISGKQSGRPVAVKYNLPIKFQPEKGQYNILIGEVEQTTPSSTDSLVKYSPRIYYNGPTGVIEGLKIRFKDNPPLYFLNGEEIAPEAIGSIHPDTFQSIEVLKDAAATSIYGEKGRNGVVKITTKKATPKKDR